MKITFQVLKVRAKKKQKIGGKWVTRSKTFEQTVNPWNKNADGTIKTPREVLTAVEQEAREWELEPITL